MNKHPIRNGNCYQFDGLACEAKKLSPREAQIVVLSATGCSTEETADILGIKTGTVNKIRSNVYFKLGVNSAGHMVGEALKTGLLRIAFTFILGLASSAQDYPRPKTQGRPTPTASAIARTRREEIAA